MSLDDFWPPAEPVAVETPRKCGRHEWVAVVPGDPEITNDIPLKRCARCGKPRDEAKSRMGRNNRKRGNAIQRSRITALGGRNLAGNNPNLDGLGLAFRYESKSGGSFPERLHRWLKGIPVQAGQTAVLIVTETPGPGRKARSVVVVDFDDWKALHFEDDPTKGAAG